MSRYLPDIAGLFALIVFLVFALLISDQFLADGDPFWHIKAGSVMLEQGRLLTQDIFSHTAYGKPWTAHEWLSEIIMAGLHRMAGLEGVILFFILLTAMTFWLLFKVAERLSNEKIALVMVSIALLFSGVHLTARPHLFSWFFLVLTLFILTTGGKRLYWLPLLTALWANLHGGFVLSLLLQGIFIAGHALDGYLQKDLTVNEHFSRLKHPLIVLLLSLAASGLNPFGYHLLLFPFHVTSGIFSTHISEWTPPNFQELWYFRYTLLLLVFALTLRNFRLAWTERLLLLFFLNAALIHSRNVSLFFLVMAPCLARVTKNWWEDCLPLRFHRRSENLSASTKSGPLAVLFTALVFFLAGAMDNRALVFLRPEKIFGVEREALQDLADYLEKARPPGRLFNDYILGGYLLYAVEPAPKVFIDGRADMYGEKIFADYGRIVLSERKRHTLLEEYEIKWVVFREESDLVYSLEQTGRWRPVHQKGPYAVLIKTAE